MNFIFWGGKAIGNHILKGLLDQNRIPGGIILYRDILDTTLVTKAKLKGTQVLYIQSFKKQQETIIEFVKEINPDLYVSVGFPFILSPEILSYVKFPVNIHTGALPKYRGHHPISAAFLNDEPFQASTVHLMAEQVDAGKIILQDYIKISNEDTILSVRTKLIDLSLKLLLLAIQQLENGTIYLRDQVGEVIWAPKKSPEDSRIDFSRPSRYLHNFIRALVDPYPNAFAFRNKDRVLIKKSVACNQPGKILADLGNQTYVISTGDGVILIETDIDLKVNDILQSYD